MVKRKCGTCRHFKDGGIASSGWCQHPARRDIQNMVFVRKTELACRNSWDQDLWEEAGTADRHGSDVPALQPGVEIPGYPAPPGYSGHHDGGSRDNSDLFTDRLTSISVTSGAPAVPATAPTVLAPTAKGHVPADPDSDSIDKEMIAALEARNAVREARRRRQELKNREQRLRQEANLQTAGELLAQGADDAGNELAPTELAGSIDRDRPPARQLHVPTFNTEGRETRSAEPPVVRQRRSIVDDASVPTTPPSAGLPEPSIELGGRRTRFAELPASGAARRGDPASEPRSGHVDHGTTQLPTAEVAAGAKSVTRPDQPRRETPRHAAQTATSARTGQDEQPPRLAEPPVSDRPTRWLTGAAAVGQPGVDGRAGSSRRLVADHEAIVPMTDIRRAPSEKLPGSLPTDPIDRSERLRTMLRQCGTCRHFKRSGDSESGWCTCTWAFTDRRAVQAQQLACRSTIGVWWVPHDDLWLERADTAHHGRPTPLLDEMTRLRSEGKQGMGSRSG